MQYYNLAIEDSIAEKVLAFLKSFPQKQVEVIPNKTIENNMEKDELFGMFSHYVTHRISDEEIAEGIAEGAYQRAMKGMNDD